LARLIDTSVFISLERSRLTVEDLIRSNPDEALALAAVTASELLAGVHLADDARRFQRGTFVESILTRLPALPFDLDVARVHARLGAHMQSVGTPIGAHDLQIAATALAHSLQLSTQNLRHFGSVPGLMVIDIELPS
jgi:tRNA(fMet)-specific endonuclease VapC